MIRNLLVIRFSAFGDVAMTVPSLKALATQYPDIQITILSRSQYAPLFENLPSNIHFAGADLKGRHSGIKGLNLLLEEIGYKHFDAVADLHNVLRSRYLDFRFRLAGKKVAVLDKGRYEKWQLTRRWFKKLRQLPAMFERHKQVFRQLGLDYAPDVVTHHPEYHNICIAPFAAHQGKMYPIDMMEQVVKALSYDFDSSVVLLGADGKEKEILQQWADKYDNVYNLAGTDMSRQLDCIRHSNFMICMDSANMHLASMVGTPVLSIWGATHPYSGFLGYGQSIKACMQLDLPCRPCSVFGNKRCRYGDYHCLTAIKPEQIIYMANNFHLFRGQL